MLITLFIVLGFALWKWWTYKLLCIGLMYFAEMDHEWEITDKELKKILEYSIKRELKDFFN